jgi:undecaprenyl phosphate N,N'-diacetylbacillosamine 1-phosphate transferase
VKGDTQLRVKRVTDVLCSLCGLVVCSPLLGVAGLAVKLDSAGPAFFALDAAGLGGRSFRQWKLRTMVNGARENGDRFETSADDPRITRVGHLLRRWSVDELPQLWNVLRGEMSLVGPRPTFVEVAAKYSPAQSRRLAMRPGVTGLAQVSGRNALSWEERIPLDIYYVEHYSLGMDLRILALTVPALFRGSEVYGKDGRVRLPDPG